MQNEVEVHHSHHRALDALNEIKLMIEEDLPHVRESVFKEYFLPVLTGDVVKNKEDEKVRLDYWVNHATVRKAQNGNMTLPNPNLPVRVVDDKDESIVLFTVPAIVPSFDETAERSRVSVVNIVNVGMKKEEQHPRLGRRFVEDILDDVFKQSRTNDLSVTQKQWLAILIRYGLAEKITGVKIDSPAATENVSAAKAFTDEIDEI